MVKSIHTRSLVPPLTGVGAAVLLLASGSAMAHSGHRPLESGLFSSFFSGVTHPITGLDHLVMLVGVGLIAAQYKQRNQQARIMLAALFSMLLGLGFGALSGFATGIETLILASVFVAAVAVYSRQRAVSNGWSVALSVLAVVAVMFHGWAHGLEASASSLVAFAPGMLVSAGLLAISGFKLGQYLTPKWQSALLAMSGTLLAIAA
ncbi:HupE/UreJ family protein [Photobacterium alginatilyticum]|jgi:urease accessory protein|uniref:Urease accessory protein UreJ n=1 Tax=Photobacterium alginatilyticum TaxID=1775171 RepID=A0ABW9YKH3_9GAMM|nr:HupE/UreJ family protein [Photobacterium alginatilyticum]NBI54278.1 urease accessory protein UreJ [Photobacterium alginatilyticum]